MASRRNARADDRSRQSRTCLLVSDAALAVRLGGKFSSQRSAGCPEAWRLLTRRAPLPATRDGVKSGACYARADAPSESRLPCELRGNQTASSGGPLVDFVVGGHQGEAFPFGEPDINRVGCAQPRRDGHASNPLRTLRTNRHQRGVRKKAADEAVHLSRRKARTRKCRGDLDSERSPGRRWHRCPSRAATDTQPMRRDAAHGVEATRPRPTRRARTSSAPAHQILNGRERWIAALRRVLEERTNLVVGHGFGSTTSTHRNLDRYDGGGRLAVAQDHDALLLVLGLTATGSLRRASFRSTSTASRILAS